MKQLQELQNSIGYHFLDETLLQCALTHRSYGVSHNERLEFIGDSLIGYWVSDRMYTLLPQASEGLLTRVRAGLIKRSALAKFSRQLMLGSCLLMGPKENFDRKNLSEALLANLFESVVGALLKDGGFSVCDVFLQKMYAPIFADQQQLLHQYGRKDAKTKLQEYCQHLGWGLPIYTLDETTGPQHAQQFHIRCQLAECDYETKAQALTRKLAEQFAADRLLDYIQKGEVNESS